MPEYDSWDLDQVVAGRATALTELHAALGLDPDRQLEGLPQMMTGENFASFGHLNPTGRAKFTASLAESLRRDRQRYPWK
jgi:hypothetical protein